METTVGNMGSKELSRKQNIALWVIQILAAGMFFMAAYGKLTGNPQMVAVFQTIGAGQWFRFLTGGIELVSAILLLVPGFSGVGALLIIPTMIGAVATHLFILGGSPAAAAILLVGSLVIAYGRRKETLRLIGRK